MEVFFCFFFFFFFFGALDLEYAAVGFKGDSFSRTGQGDYRRFPGPPVTRGAGRLGLARRGPRRVAGALLTLATGNGQRQRSNFAPGRAFLKRVPLERAYAGSGETQVSFAGHALPHGRGSVNLRPTARGDCRVRSRARRT